jgi:hypothetical protein
MIKSWAGGGLVTQSAVTTVSETPFVLTPLHLLANSADMDT